MGKTEWPIDPGFAGLAQPPAFSQPKAPVPTLWQSLENAFVQENEMVNMVEWLRRPAFKEDPNYDPAEYVPNSPLFEQYGDELSDARSEEELRWLEQRIALGEQRRQTQAAAGLPGLLFGIAAGVLGPSSLIPLTTPVRGARGMMIMGRNAAIAAGVNEGVLALNQPLRTQGEIIEGFATQTVLGAMLGGAAQYFRGAADEVVPEIYAAYEPVLVPQTSREIALRQAMGTMEDFVAPIPRMELVVPGGSVNAAINPAIQKDPGGLKQSGIAPNVLARMGAGTRVVYLGATDTARRASQMLDDAGLLMERNADFVPTAVGGTVRHRISTWYGPLAKSLTELDRAYVAYKLGTEAKGLTTVRAAVPRKGKMSRQEFNAEVSLALNYGDEHHIPEVAQAAKVFRAEVLEPMARAAQKAELLPEKLDVKGAVSYLMRLYDTQNISRDPQGFVNLLASHFQKKFQERIAAASARAQEEATSATQRAADLELSPQDAAKLAKDLEEEFAYLNEYHPGAALDRDLKEFANEKRRQTRGGEDTSNTQASKEAYIERRKKVAPEEFELMKDYRVQRRRIRTRMKNLSENRFALREKQAELLRKADAAEEANLKALESLIAKAKQVEDKLNKVSDEVLDAELAKLRKQVEGIARRMEKADAQLIKLRAEAAELLADETVDFVYAPKTSSNISGAPTSARKEESSVVHMDGGDDTFAPTEGPYDAKTLAALKQIHERHSSKPFDPQDPRGTKAKLRELAEDRDIRAKIAETWATNERRAERYELLANRLEAAEDMERTRVRATIELVLDDAVTTTQRIIANRAVRRQALLDRANAIDPEGVTKEAARLRENARMAPIRQRRRMESGKRGISHQDIAIKDGKLVLKDTQTAQRLAEEFRDWVMGTPIRTPGFDVLQAERGPALMRMLDIDYRVLQPYLKTDVEAILKAYVRTMAPDIEIKRTFGDPGLQNVIGQGGKMDQELNQKLRALQEEGLDEAELAKRNQYLQDRHEQDKLDLATMVQRLRHTRGIPDDPTHMFYRIGRTIKDVNVFTLMGSVVPSSLADVARPMIKFGLLNTMRHAWIPWITHLRSMKKIAKREIAPAGGAVDLTLHSRFLAMMDIMDDQGRRTLFERGAQQLAQKTGIVAMFDYWNVAHKQMVAGIANAELWKQMDVISSANPSKRALQNAQEFLASYGFDEFLVGEFQRLRAEGKGTMMNGTFWPETAQWDSENATVFRAFLNKAMEDTIVTPGAADRPRWVDKNIGYSLLAQFRSFTLSSTFKTVLAGMQDAKARTLTGFMLSMGLGALSYWVYGHTAGGKARERMLNASDEEWVWEALMRSGMLGILAEPMMLTEAAGQEFRPEVRLAQQVLGPSMGLMLAGAGIGSELYQAGRAGLRSDEDIDISPGITRNIRRFIPYQNVFYLRSVFNDAEQAMKDALK